MAQIPRQGAARLTESRHKRMSEEAGRTVDDTYANIAWATDTKANCTMFSFALLGRRYLSALRDCEQMQ